MTRPTLLRSIIAALLLAGPLAAQAVQVPLAAFVKEDQYSNPLLAPDGKHIAVTARVPSGDRFVQVVMFYSLPDLKQVGALRMPRFEVPIDYKWVGNNRLVIAKGKEPGSREKPQVTGEILATNVDGSKQDYLFGMRMFSSSRRGDRYADDEAWGGIEDLPRPLNQHFFLTAHDWDNRRSMLYDVDSHSVIRRLIADIPSPLMSFVMQNNGTPRFASGVGDDAYAVLYRYDDAAASWNKVTGRKDFRYHPQAFLSDDSRFVATYSADGGPDQLIEENLASGQRTVLYADKESSAGALEYGARRGVPFAVASTVGIPRLHYFDASSADAQLHQRLSAAFPGSNVHFINFTEDGATLLFGVHSDRDPGSYYLFQRSTGNAELLFASMAEIEPADMRSHTPITFKARDGLVLHGYLTMPEHAAGAKVPLVLMPHGGPHGVRDDWYFDTDAQFLASRGYAVLQVNFRGSGGRGVKFERAGYRQWGAAIQDDLADGIKWAIAQGAIDGTRVCTYGASFGGYAALMLAAREPDLIKCAVGYVGVYDLELMLAGERVAGSKTARSFYQRFVGDDKAELARFSPARLAERIKAPVLLVHGGKDKTAPPEQAEAMRAALIAVKRPPQWLMAPDEGHGFYDTENRTRFYETLQGFLDQHIGK